MMRKDRNDIRGRPFLRAIGVHFREDFGRAYPRDPGIANDFIKPALLRRQKAPDLIRRHWMAAMRAELRFHAGASPRSCAYSSALRISRASRSGLARYSAMTSSQLFAFAGGGFAAIGASARPQFSPYLAFSSSMLGRSSRGASSMGASLRLPQVCKRASRALSCMRWSQASTISAIVGGHLQER